MLKDKQERSIILIVLTVRQTTVMRVIFVRDLCVPTVFVRCLAAIFVLVLDADNMKNTKKITLCGMIAALSVAIMMTSYFPYLTYAIPALAGLFMMVPLIECGVIWSVGTYFASSVIIAIIAEKEAAILYIMLVGYYPIVKSLIERINNQFIEWIIKIVGFNIIAVAFYFVLGLVGINSDTFGDFGKYTSLIFLAICNIVFVIYDIGISRVASYYICLLYTSPSPRD